MWNGRSSLLTLFKLYSSENTTQSHRLFTNDFAKVWTSFLLGKKKKSLILKSAKGYQFTNVAGNRAMDYHSIHGRGNALSPLHFRNGFL